MGWERRSFQNSICSGGGDDHDEEGEVLEQAGEALLGFIEGNRGLFELGDIASTAPESMEQAIFNDAPLGAEHKVEPGIGADGGGFDGMEAVAGSDEVQGSGADGGVGEEETLSLRGAPMSLLRGIIEAELAGEREVALGDVAIAVYRVQLLRFGQGG